MREKANYLLLEARHEAEQEQSLRDWHVSKVTLLVHLSAVGAEEP